MEKPDENVTKNKSSDRIEESYEWYPKDVSLDLFEKYVNSLPDDKRPIKNSIGADYRRKQMEKQLPMHDFEISNCDSLANEYDRGKFNEFIKKYEKPSIGLGAIKDSQETSTLICCYKCNNEFLNDKSDVIVKIKHNLGYFWHSYCFTCSTCDELLVDLIYFYYNKTIYCGRHFCEKMKPRCAACDELIFSKEYTKAENQNWHLNHFCCWKCDKPLGGTKYIIIDSKPYCLECNNLNFSKKCDACHEIIDVNTPSLKFNSTNWHSSEKCFSCFTCRKSLVSEKFIFRSGYIFCGIECKRRIIPKRSNCIGNVIQL